MNKVFKANICIDENFVCTYPVPNIQEVDMSNEVFQKFNWDKLNRIEVVDRRQIIILSTDRSRLEGYLRGFHEGRTLEEVFGKIKGCNIGPPL